MEIYNPINGVVDKIIERIADEYYAQMFYRNVANWLGNAGYVKAAAVFAKEALHEAEHATKLEKLLTDYGNTFTLPAIPACPEVASFPDLIRSVYKLEADLAIKYNTLANEIWPVDKAAYNLIMEMVQIQYDSVAEARTWVDRLDLVDNSRTGLFLYEAETFG